MITTCLTVNRWDAKLPPSLLPPPIRCFSVPFSCPVIVRMRSGEVKWIENQLAECFCLFFLLFPKAFQLQRSSVNRFTVGDHGTVWSIQRHHQGLLAAKLVTLKKIPSLSHSYFLPHISSLSPSLALWGGVCASLSSFRDKRNVHTHLPHREPVLIK